MGAYLSEPVTDKISTDEVGERVKCGASSMQGWRISQEDAHNCTIDYDTNTSFFAVYDGHGGHEVALYSAQHLPQYLKNCEAYKKGDYTQALKDAFLEFDATLTTPEVIAILKQIANNKDGEQNSASDEEEENVKNLYEEAEMPLEQVMAKYQHDHINSITKKLKQDDGKPPGSPFLRARRSCTAGASSSGASSSKCKQIVESGNGSAESEEDSRDKKDGDGEVSSSSQGQGSSSSSSSSASKSTSGSKEDEQAYDSAASNGDSKHSDDVEIAKNKETLPDSSGDSKIKKADNSGKEKLGKAGDGKQELNGESEEKKIKVEDVSSSSAPCENGEVGEGEGKGKAKVNNVEEGKRSTRSVSRRYANNLYSKLLTNQDNSDSDDSDEEEDESFQGADEENSSDDDGAEDEDDGEEGDVDEDENEEDEDEEEDDDSAVDEEEDDDDDDFALKMTEEPGSDSGCTAVVALLKGQELYVANAGDSRCVVCRKGKAIEMSLDHKPEDEIERARIVKAGGKVTGDGRVNGGLNLSRALGDHAYKQTEGMSAEEQMITALPDVRTLMIDPAEDEFMILACDGIWNSMSSQEVVDFIRPRIQEAPEQLSKICEELFDRCLAVNTLGDGTGCDNMTSVIVQFRPALADLNENKSLKRAASPGVSESSSDSAKRPKTEEVSV